MLRIGGWIFVLAMWTGPCLTAGDVQVLPSGAGPRPCLSDHQELDDSLARLSATLEEVAVGIGSQATATIYDALLRRQSFLEKRRDTLRKSLVSDRRSLELAQRVAEFALKVPENERITYQRRMLEALVDLQAGIPEDERILRDTETEIQLILEYREFLQSNLVAAEPDRPKRPAR